ncbi:MAG: Uma2 family endonuclease [Coleofasciculaceae cyanobacterium SM2_1_6]|nr:Uma2 family endonuclease [Coleofasciculaceae cyanobacterium SM2_1_6]
MSIAPTPPKTYTPAEYLAREVEAETRHEYRNGEIIPMSGGTPAHNEIVSNLIFILKSALKSGLQGQNYSIFAADQRLWIPESNTYTYPDVVVVPKPIELQPGRKDTIANPVLIAEVLSNSTKAYDRDEKFAAYRTVSTFQEYLLIDQTQPHVEQYRKQGINQWLFQEYKGRGATIMIESLSVELKLVDLYENIEFV